jgi:hypothetical protein
MASPRTIDYRTCWTVSGVKSAEKFFRAIPMLVPEATYMFLEGSPATDIVAIFSPFMTHKDYGAPVGTLWSWPRDQRFSLATSLELYGSLSEAARHHAGPEICSHVHFYRDGEPLLHWFDAFNDPIIVSKAVSPEQLERFCIETGGVLSDGAV